MTKKEYQQKYRRRSNLYEQDLDAILPHILPISLLYSLTASLSVVERTQRLSKNRYCLYRIACTTTSCLPLGILQVLQGQ